MRSLLLFAVVSSSSVLLGAAPGRVVVTLIGHEGFLVRSGSAAVMFDGFLARGTSADDSLLTATYDQMLARKGLFTTVDLALVSHEHKDHFDPEVALSFMAKHAETRFKAMPEAFARLKTANGFEGVAPRLSELSWQESTRVSFDVGRVHVEAIKVGHEAHEFFDLDVGLYIVTLNGVKVLHAADADLTDEHVQALHLEKENLDVAFVAFSFFSHPDAARVLADHVAARQVVVMHLPAANLEQAKEVVLKVAPKAIFFVRPLETRSL